MVTRLWTDGACSHEVGAGGWAAVLTTGRATRELAGSATGTTNNRMELTGVIEGLKAMRDDYPVIVHTDSAYVLNSVVRGWLEGWKRRGWTTGAGEPVKNPDLWILLDAELARREVEWSKVVGHSGVRLNERADELARRGRDAAIVGEAWAYDHRLGRP